MCLEGCTPSRPAPTQDAGPPVTPCPCSVTLTPNPLGLCSTTTGTLTATGTPAGGTYAWSSGNTAVVTVSGSGATATATNVSVGTAIITVTYSPPGCAPCTATATVNACKCTFGFKYTFAGKSVASLIGGKARIKTRLGKLCCEGCATTEAAYFAFVNVMNQSSGIKWAQCGYGRTRSAGSASVVQFRYTEIQGNTYNTFRDTANPPAEGSVHEWKCELNKATGQWSYFQDGTSFSPFTDPFWASALGDGVQWEGEIHNTEDDMPGTASNKCNFTECQYRVDGAAAYVDAGLVAANIGTTDASEWGVELVSGTAFNIWDKKPLP